MQNRDYSIVLYEWISHRNQVWLQQANYSNLDFVTNMAALSPEVRKAEQISLTQNKRNVSPLKRESTILHLQENGYYNHQLQLSILLRTNTSYSIHYEIIEEAIEENVCIVLLSTIAGWKIDDVCFLNKPFPFSGGNSILSVHPGEGFGVLKQESSYDRVKAVQYAEKWWNTHNPAYRYFGDDDCTNFISQCLLAGGIPMSHTKKRGAGWWYRGANENWSLSWAVAHSLATLLATNKSSGPRAERREQAKGLEIGDIICYDWEGNGRWDHNTIVTKIDPNGEPLVNAHSIDSKDRYWKYTDSHAYREGKTRYAFFHILN